MSRMNSLRSRAWRSTECHRPSCSSERARAASCSRATTDRRDWKVRGPFCEGWPIYHAVHDAASGAIYAAAASEWHGAGVWRSSDLGETLGALERGARLRRRRPEAVEGLGAGGGARARARRRARRPASSRAATAARPGRCSARSTASRAASAGTSRRTSRRAISACRRSCRTPTSRPASGPSCRASASSRRRTTARRGRRATAGLRADWPLEDPEVGFCVHKLVMSPVDRERLYQQNHCGMHRSDDGGRSWIEITEGLPTDFGFAAAAHPHDRDTLLRHPARPGPRTRCMPDGHAAVWRTRDAGSTWQRLDRGPAAARRAPRRAARGHGDRHARRRPASTSAPAPARCSRAPTRARAGTRSRATCPAIASVEVAVLA